MILSTTDAAALAAAKSAKDEAAKDEAVIKADILAMAAPGEAITVEGAKVGTVTTGRTSVTYSEAAVFAAMRDAGIGEDRARLILANAAKVTHGKPSVSIRWDALAVALS